MSQLNLSKTATTRWGVGTTHATFYRKPAPNDLFASSQVLLCTNKASNRVVVIIRGCSKTMLRERVMCSRCQRLLAPATRRKSA
jgi:hypothetical protein